MVETPQLTAPAAVVRTHLDELTGPLGIYQHARASSPNLGQGYCTDDVARAVIVDVLHSRVIGRAAVAIPLARSLQFLEEAVVPGMGRFRNFRDADGNWLEQVGSADAHARAVQALGVVIGDGLDGLSSSARLFAHVLPVSLELDGLRPWAHVLLGCDAAMAGARPPDGASVVFSEMAHRLAAEFAKTDPTWPWPEAAVTYESAILGHALITAGQRLGDPVMAQRGLSTLEWLIQAQVTSTGTVELIGNQGWWPRGGTRARFDQQPIDAAALVEACSAAWAATGERRWLVEMRRAYSWFLGANAIGIAVADPERGGCRDGLSPIGVNANQGAESTLAWLTATEVVRATPG